jgi:Glycosyltransferase family 87
MEKFVGRPEAMTRNAVVTKPRRLSGKTPLTVLFAFCLLLVVTAYAFTRPLQDFVEYWTAGHLLVAHANPYSLPAVFQIQKNLGWSESVPLTFVCPPWALSLIAPLGIFRSYSLAWLAWFVMLTSSLSLASCLLVNMYFGEVRIPEVTETTWQRSLFALTFYPAVLSAKFAQTAPLLLLGLAGFLYFESRERPTLAGICVTLTLIKPQLLVLVWLALVLDSYQRSRWKLLGSAAATLGCLTAIALFLDPRAIGQYWELVRSPYLAINPSGITAAIRRLFGARDTYWMQFIPPIFGLIWFAFCWQSQRKSWSWKNQMPALVAVSLLTTPYGWLFDQTLLTIPIIALAGRYARQFGYLPRNMVFLYTALNVTLILLAMASSPWSFVPAPVVIAFLLYREARAGNNFSSGVRYSYVGTQS